MLLDVALLNVVVFDVADVVEGEFDEAVMSEGTALLDVAGAEVGLDGTDTLLLLLDEETCGAEGVEVGDGESA